MDDCFKDVSSSRKSEVWKHVLFNKAKELGKCKICSKVLKATGSSTKNLSGHLKSRHNVTIKSCYEIDTEPKNKLPRLDLTAPKIPK